MPALIYETLHEFPNSIALSLRPFALVVGEPYR